MHPVDDPLHSIVNRERHPIRSEVYSNQCRDTLAREGVLVLHDFLTPSAIATIRHEGEASQHRAFYSTQTHNVYLAPADPSFPADHPRNRAVVSSKGCIADDVVPPDSPLRALYESDVFREFLCGVLGERALHPYADPLSSINLHYASAGQELGWHFDNSAFAITLMIQPPERGGAFEYLGGVRLDEHGEDDFDAVARVLDREVEPLRLTLGAGALVLFRGRNAMHRVAPVEGDRTRMLAVLAYNAKPDISLSESARMTFYGRLD